MKYRDYKFVNKTNTVYSERRESIHFSSTFCFDRASKFIKNYLNIFSKYIIRRIIEDIDFFPTNQLWFFTVGFS